MTKKKAEQQGRRFTKSKIKEIVKDNPDLIDSTLKEAKKFLQSKKITGKTRMDLRLDLDAVKKAADYRLRQELENHPDIMTFDQAFEKMVLDKVDPIKKLQGLVKAFRKADSDIDKSTLKRILELKLDSIEKKIIADREQARKEERARLEADPEYQKLMARRKFLSEIGLNHRPGVHLHFNRIGNFIDLDTDVRVNVSFESHAIAEIAEERHEQMNRHGKTVEFDSKYQADQLVGMAKYCLTLNNNDWPLGCGLDQREKIMKKDFRGRMITAAALLASQIDVDAFKASKKQMQSMSDTNEAACVKAETGESHKLWGRHGIQMMDREHKIVRDIRDLPKA